MLKILYEVNEVAGAVPITEFYNGACEPLLSCCIFRILCYMILCIQLSDGSLQRAGSCPGMLHMSRHMQARSSSPVCCGADLAQG